MLARVDPRETDRIRISELEEENRQLKDRIARLRGNCDAVVSRDVLDLTECESVIFALLLHRGVAGYSLIEETLYSQTRLEVVEDPQLAIRCHVKRLRRKMRPHGFGFETIYGFGYGMTEECRCIARKQLAANSARYRVTG